ncbi:MAG: anhydro-N-acetylmuramic acid kinase [Acidobacteriaceae bacterium]|jgi:anhydro-N-acetylmuramic acid kinase
MKPLQPKLGWKPLLVAGVMSGTSADGVDVAFCKIAPALRADTAPRFTLLGHRSFAYNKKLRALILNIAAGNNTTAAELSQLAWRLGELYADCIATTSCELNLKPQLAAMHGQTIYHQATAAKFLGAPIRCTSQIGEPAVLAERLRIPVTSDFRPADLAAGGQGAPLVPMLDFCLFRHTTKNCVLLNLGGIANVTALPAACTATDVLAFDTGPASILIDLLMQQLYNRRLDKSGAVAASGQILKPVLDRLLTTPYFSTPTPKSCGREEFGPAFAHQLLALCKQAPKQDVIATATALTAATIIDAYRRFCWPHLGQHAPLARATELIAAGGGTKNLTLMRLLTDGFAQLGVKVSTTASAGLPVEAKEAAAFALLGWLTWHGLPGNIPSATGASRSVILGKVTYA